MDFKTKTKEITFTYETSIPFINLKDFQISIV